MTVELVYRENALGVNVIWEPSKQLRWMGNCLQQLWYGNDGASEWRDIPRIEGESV